MLEKARSRGKYLVKRQTGLLQGNGTKKGNIQVSAPPGDKPTGAVTQSFHGIEGAELAPRVRGEPEFSLDPPCHYGLMISVVYDQRWTFGKTGGKLGLEPVPGHGGLYKSRIIFSIASVREACGSKGTLAIKAFWCNQPSIVRAVIEVGQHI